MPVFHQQILDSEILETERTVIAIHHEFLDGLQDNLLYYISGFTLKYHSDNCIIQIAGQCSS